MKANTMAAIALVLLCGLAASNTCNAEGRGLLQEPVEQAFAGEVARDSLSRLTAAQNLAAAEAAAAAKPIVTPATTTPATPAGGAVAASSAQSPKELCLLAQLAANNPSALQGSDLTKIKAANCTGLSTTIPLVEAAAGPAAAPTATAPAGGPNKAIIVVTPATSGAAISASSAWSVLGGAVAGAALLMACPTLF